ncbi:tRNA wybutosine-synthesizing protein [Thraustotheca clavata]|uniref:tRNA(Phe) 7-[(3-amino-3-carboxypropyl)-4-demethylwyosine(37)-N(4)]-methyltransferase n=1 Tax=Thraustotheca clavata TaxID=74557 RepID=A0A1V9ZV58_9STRA|nr:tRNA wybutosine-synthesizing protein [Thraustotheca clavata]
MLAFDASKRESLQKLQDAIDKSPKGSIDAPIVDMIEALNAHPNYVTSSSYSGRIAVFCGVAQNEATLMHLITKGGKWLVSSHAPVSYDELHAKVLADPSVLNGMVIFKHEPFIMHVQCRDEEAAKVMLQCGLACGFRESGIVLGNKKTMVAIRTTANSMEIPIALNGKLMLDENYLQWILAIANEKFEANRLKTQRFMQELDSTLFSLPRMLLQDVAASQADTVVPRAGHSNKNSLCIVGGQGQTSNGTARLSDLVIFDRTTKNVIKTTALSMSPRMHHTAVERQGKLILFGGRASPAKPLNDLISIDMTSFNVENITVDGSPPSPRWGHTSILVGTKMIVIGGRNATSVLSDVHILDLSSKTPSWKYGACGKPMFAHSAVNVKGKIYCFGGRSNLDALSDISLDTIQVYDSTLDNWSIESTSGKTIPSARSNAQAVIVQDQHGILTAGIQAERQ